MFGIKLSFFQTGHTADEQSRKREREEQRKFVQNEVKNERASSVSPIFTKDQEMALATMQKGNNIFLTGGAGTGKSFILRKFIEINRGRNILVTAPTGIAAKNIGGATLHKTFKLPLGLISDKYIQDTRSISIDRMKYREKMLSHTDILIIDEISMCRADIFMLIADLIQKQSAKGHHIQLILCGDFYQLPPVIKDKEKAVFNAICPANPYGWSFKTKQWSQLNIEVCELKEIVRQKDINFAASLNKVRIGDKQGLSYITSNCSQEYVENAITLCGTNFLANRINEDNLKKIDSQIKSYEIKVNGNVSDSEICCEKYLDLKVGARVIILVNEANLLYQNGSFATVTELKEESITVLLDDKNVIVELPFNTWEVYGYSVDENSGKIKKQVVGTYSQIPVRLGWAVTIHKSQGATYSKVNLDTFRLWSSGQLYVALSRCSSLENLYYKEDVSNHLFMDLDVIKFYMSIASKNQK